MRSRRGIAHLGSLLMNSRSAGPRSLTKELLQVSLLIQPWLLSVKWPWRSYSILNEKGESCTYHENEPIPRRNGVSSRKRLEGTISCVTMGPPVFLQHGHFYDMLL